MTESQPPKPNSPTAKRNLHVASIGLLVLITILACGLRLYRSDESLWVDELHTAWTVSSGLGSVSERAAIGNQSPFYFYLTCLSRSCFGSSELSIRLPSLVVGVLLVPLIFVVIYRWTGSFTSAHLAAFLVAIDPEFIFYAQEARPYALVQLLGLVSVLAFSQLVSSLPTKGAKQASPPIAWRITFVLSSTLLFYSHYTAGLLLVAEGFCYAMLFVSRKWSPYISWKSFTIDMLIVGLMCLPALPHLIEIIGRRDDWRGIIDAGTVPTLLRMLDTYLLMPTAVITSVLLICWLQRRLPFFERLKLRVLIVVICWLIVPLGTYWIATVVATLPVFMFRYVVVSASAAIAFACLITSLARPKVRWVVGLLIAAGAVWTSGIAQRLQANGQIISGRNEDWKSVVILVNTADGGKFWPVLLQAGLIEDHRLASDHNELFHTYCLFPVTSLYSIDATHKLVPLPSGRVPEIDNSIVAGAGVWLIIRSRADDAKAIAQAFCERLRRHDTPYEMRVRYSKGSLHLFEITSNRDN